jgi:alpha-beta hydrolase superfamily lysophospholipase
VLRKSLRWLRTRRKRKLGVCLGALFLLPNVVAFMHAYRMTHYDPDGAAFVKPESLSWPTKVRLLLTGRSPARPENAGTPQDFELPFTVHRFASAPDVELEAWHIPHPDARGLVLFFPGYGSAKSGLLPEAQVFHDLGYAAFLVDFRGCGGSSGNVTSLGMHEAADVGHALDYARAHWPGLPMVLYGRSMGSAAVLRAVARNGVRPDALIVECPFDRLSTTVAHRFSAMGVPSFPGATLLVFWGGLQQGANAFAHNPVEYAAAVTCPALLLHGGQDPRVKPEEARSVYEAFAGPKQFELFKDAGHESYLGSPEQWRRTVAGFLGRHAATRFAQVPR